MKKNVLVFGLISGLVVSTIMAISMTYMSRHPELCGGVSSMVVGYLSMLLAFSLIFVAVKNFRDQQNGGAISFGKAFTIGVLISLIASTMYVITWALVYHFVMPDFMDRYVEQIIEHAKASSSPAELQKLTEQMNTQRENYKNPVFFSLMTYMEILPVGIIVSLIVAIILKRKAATA